MSTDNVTLDPRVSRVDFSPRQKVRLQEVVSEAKRKQDPPPVELLHSFALREATFGNAFGHEDLVPVRIALEKLVCGVN